MGNPVVEEVSFSDFQLFEGLSLPTHAVVKHGDSIVQELSAIQYRINSGDEDLINSK